jgi:hypothetical protein
MPRPLVLLVALLAALLSAQLSAPSARAEAPAEPLRLLFIGNSLTSTHDLPLIVQAMAAQQGCAVKVTVRAVPDFSLEDHWKSGARNLLASTQPDFVILQQGPSTRPESREHLARWTRAWADVARATAKPAQVALFMVWPISGTRDGFKLVSRSYREAAEANQCRLLAAGDAWAAVLALSHLSTLHDPDGLHPNLSGSFLAAMVIARGLTGIDPALVPARLKLASGRIVTVPEETLARFRTVLAAP